MSALPRLVPAAAALLALAAAGCSGAAPPRARPPAPEPSGAVASGAAAPGGPVAAPAGERAASAENEPPAASPGRAGSPPAIASRGPTGLPPLLPRAALFADPAAAASSDGARHGRFPPGLAASALAAAERVTYLARDGMEVRALLTLPPGLPAGLPPGGLPLVVLVRSEAGGRSRRGFDPRVQLLASRGYAVLRPDGRGAGVPGADPAAAGEPWSPAALDDLADGVVELVRRGVADGDRVAIVGAGYGGWAALASIAATPDLYAAAVALDARADLVPPGAGGPVVAGSAVAADGVVAAHPPGAPPGVVSAEPAAAVLRAPHPAPAGAVDVRAPLLLARSADPPPPLAASTDALAAALRPGCRELEYLVTSPGTPSASEGPDRLAVWAAAELFLSRHLGGRLEEIPAELAERVAALRVDLSALPPPATSHTPLVVETAGARP